MQSYQIIIGIILLAVIWTFIEQKLLVTASYTIKSAKLPKSKALSFVLLADLHNRTFGRNNERLVRHIDKLHPDYILVAGDMINKKAPSYPSNIFKLLESLSKKYKIYYAYGNHEQKMDLLYRAEIAKEDTTSLHDKASKAVIDNKVFELKKLSETWVEFREKLTALGVVFLDNETITLNYKNTKFLITGLSIGPEYFEWNEKSDMETDYLRKLVGVKDKDYFQILIAHNPVFFKSYIEWGADLTVSGHFHGGMVRIPGIGGVISPQAKFFPKYDSGMHSENGRHMVVSRGLGSHSIMPRLFNIPELVYIELESEL